MSLVILGVNHRTAPLDILERLTIPAARVPKALADLSGRTYVSESVLLSTCNRTEVYVHAEKFHGAYQDVRDFLAQFCQVAPEDFADHLYVFHDTEAVQHLFAVTCGLDSAVLGEHEIQGQVKVAWETARTEGVVGTTLNSVFRQALEVGKRARTETAISRHVTSVSQAAVVVAQQHVGSLEGKRVLVLGAGDMGGGMTAAAASAVDELGSLVVASRTWDRATELAARFDGHAVHLDEVDRELIEADVVFTSTSSASYLIEYGQLAAILARREGRSLLIVDIAMPRDVDPAVNDLPGVTLLDMDAVEAYTEAGKKSRRSEVDRVNSIIEYEVLRHEQDASVREAAPLIAAFRGRVDEIRASELARHASKLEGLTPQQREAVEAVTRGVLAKVMFEPTKQLKESADSARGDRLGAALRAALDL